MREGSRQSNENELEAIHVSHIQNQISHKVTLEFTPLSWNSHLAFAKMSIKWLFPRTCIQKSPSFGGLPCDLPSISSLICLMKYSCEHGMLLCPQISCLLAYYRHSISLQIWVQLLKCCLSHRAMTRILHISVTVPCNASGKYEEKHQTALSRRGCIESLCLFQDFLKSQETGNMPMRWSPHIDDFCSPVRACDTNNFLVLLTTLTGFPACLQYSILLE